MTSLSRFDTKDAANEGRWMGVQDPENPGTILKNDEKEIRILLFGRDSDPFIRQKNINRAEEMKEVRKNIPYAQGPADDRALRLLAATTKNWEGIPISWIEGGEDEKPAPFSAENAVKLYKRQAWLFDQVDEFVGERKNFFGS